MDALKILEDARRAGIQIALEGENLAVMPSSLLSDSLRTAIRQHKQELVKALSEIATHPPDDGWNRTRRAAAHLGETVSDGKRQYQLWGITPRGAICFDGYVYRTLDLEEVGL